MAFAVRPHDDNGKYTITYIFACLFALHTVCPRSSDPLYIIGYYIKWVTTSWTHSTIDIYQPDLMCSRAQIEHTVCT